MALSNYSELKTAVADWMMDAGAEVAPQADVCVRLSQGYINLKLRAREMITVDDLTVTSGEITLPAGYLAPRRVVVTYGSRRIPLKQTTLEKSDELYPLRQSGIPCHFAIIGEKLRVFPTQADATTVELTYYTALAEMSDDTDTDWLLTKYPNTYLACGQMYAAEYLKENEEAQKQALITDTLISMINAQDEQSDFMLGEFEPYGGSPV